MNNMLNNLDNLLFRCRYSEHIQFQEVSEFNSESNDKFGLIECQNYLKKWTFLARFTSQINSENRLYES